MISEMLDRQPLRSVSDVNSNILRPCSGHRRMPLQQATVPSTTSFRNTYQPTSALIDVRANDERWLRDLEKLNDATIDDALIDVLDRMDSLLEPGSLERCRAILNLANPERLAIELSLAFLSGTLAAKNELFDARSSFYNRLETRLKREMPSDVEALLGRLRP